MFSQPKVRLIRLFVAFTLTALLAVAMLTSKFEQTAQAIPDHEVYHTHYSGPDYGTEVGEKWILCHGTYTFGTVTQYVVTYDTENYCY